MSALGELKNRVQLFFIGVSARFDPDTVRVARRLVSIGGFTLIELLVVIAIIGLLSSIVLASLNPTHAKARDALRKSELGELRNAIELYYSKCGTYIIKQNCTGTAYGSGGIGWFSYAGYAGSAGSLAQGLVDAKVMGTAVVDPSGAITHITGHTGYLLSANASAYTIWANLENPSSADTATQGKCSLSTYDSYSSTYPVSEQMNYCVSN